MGEPTAHILVGFLGVQADGPGVIGDVIFGDPAGFRYAASMPLQTTTFTKAVFSQVASSEALGFWTGLALYNPGSWRSTVTIRGYKSDGALQGEHTRGLDPGERFSQNVHELVSASRDQLGGYIVITATLPVIAQQLFGLSSLNLMSAVPPHGCSVELPSVAAFSL